MRGTKIVGMVLCLILMHGVAHAYKRIPEISLVDLRTALTTGNDRAVLVDARVYRDYKRQHIKGAISLPANKVTKAALKKITRTPNTPLVFYCGSIQCPAGHAAAFKARKLGFTNVYAYREGIAGWIASGLPVEGSYENPAANAGGDALSAFQ